MTDTSFPRSARLTTARDYQRVFADAVRSRDGGFTVLARVRESGDGRLGLAISKRAIRRAVGRNRIKRHVRESFRRQRASLAGIDVVVMAKQGVDGWRSEAIVASLTRHWQVVRRKCAD